MGKGGATRPFMCIAFDGHGKSPFAHPAGNSKIKKG